MFWVLWGALTLQRLPSLFVPFWTKDEGFWWAVGKAVADGGKLFVAAVDNKPPFFLGSYALAIKWFGDRHAMTALHAAVIAGQSFILWAIYRTSRKHWGETVARTTAFFYICLQGSFISQEVLAANSENLMMPFLMAAFLIYEGRDGKIPHLIIMGVLTGIGFFFRQTAAVFFIFFALHETLNAASWREFFRSVGRGLWVFSGFGLVFAGTCLWFRGQGSFEEFWYWTFSITREYVEESIPWRIIVWDGFWKTGVVLACQGLIWFLALSALKNGFRKIWSLFFFSMVLIVAVGWRFSHHYYLQVFPATALLAGWALSRRSSFWPLPKPLAYACLIVPLLGFTGEAVFRCFKDPSGFPRPEIRELGLWLRDHKQDRERLFIWGYYPEIYYYSGLKNASRFVETHFLTGQIRITAKADGLEGSKGTLWKLLEGDLRNPPEWLVDTSSYLLSGKYLHSMERYPEFARFVADKYALAESLHGMRIYKRREIYGANR